MNSTEASIPARNYKMVKGKYEDSAYFYQEGITRWLYKLDATISQIDSTGEFISDFVVVSQGRDGGTLIAVANWQASILCTTPLWSADSQMPHAEVMATVFGGNAN